MVLRRQRPVSRRLRALASFLGPDPAQVTAAAGAAQVGARSLLLLATNGQQS